MNNAAGIERVRQARGFVFDLDGTMILGNKNNEGMEVIDGAPELVELLSERGIPFVVLTNGTVRPPEAYEGKLNAAGLPFKAAQIMTPSVVAAEHFKASGMQRILVLGVEGVWKPLRDIGLEVILPEEGPVDPELKIDAVFVGWYKQFLLDSIEAAVRAVWGGAELYAASLVPFFATRGGKALGSSRIVSAGIESVTDAKAIPIGKPSPIAFDRAAARLGVAKTDVAVVGDDPHLEPLMAIEGGGIGVGVMSGVAGEEAFRNLPPEITPHLTVSGARELLEILK